jgi:hypothetical protein
MERSLIPKKSVFDRLHFDLSSTEVAKNKEKHEGRANLTERMDRIDRFTHSSTFQISNSEIPRAANSCLGRFQNSNAAGFQAADSLSQFCVRCLRVGHWRLHCRFPVTCHKCKRPEHYAASCTSPDKIGFQPKDPVTDCFQGNDFAKGKEIDVSGWFMVSKPSGSVSAPPIFCSFSEYLQSLCPSKSVQHPAPPPLAQTFPLRCDCFLGAAITLLKHTTTSYLYRRPRYRIPLCRPYSIHATRFPKAPSTG